MSSRYIGGIVTKSPSSPNPALGNAGNGIFTMDQYVQQKSAGTWPAYDPYFKNVTLMLHGDGTNGGQNNTFLDSSTNNFTITRNGNTTQGTFSPYGSNWSNYFDGSSYLNAGTNAAFSVGTGDFTIELWVFPTAFSGTYTGYFTTRTGGQGFDIQILNSSATLMLGNNTGAVISANNVLSLNTWQHICAVRSGSTNSLYVNGTRVATGTDSTNFTDTGAKVGSSGPSGGNNGVGYISNVRLVKGTAVYNPSSTTITVPTTPLTAISGTSILTCQSNRFIDNSTNAFTITVNGSPSVQRFSPFSPSTAYSTSVIGGSGYFDGSGDYLLTPSTGQFAPSGNFTISFWYYPTSLANYYSLVGNYTTNTSTDWLIETWGDGTIKFYLDGGTPRITSSSGTIKIGQWYYISLNRSGTTVTAYVNGTSQGTYTLSGTLGTTSKAINIGGAASDYTSGYISDVKLIDGSSVTTIPTAPQTATTGTTLLLNFTNASILDNAMMNDLETVGNAQISTSVKKYGTGSIYLDGTGDYLTCNNPASNIYQFGTGDFTVEFWAYLTNSSNDNGPIFDTRSSSSNGLLIRQGNGAGGIANRIDAVITGSATASSGTITFNTWNHIAVVRSSGTLKVYYNGTGGTGVSATGNITGTNAYIGAFYDALSINIAGYFDDLRITKGVARYTANFTPPTSQLQDQ